MITPLNNTLLELGVQPVDETGVPSLTLSMTEMEGAPEATNFFSVLQSTIPEGEIEKSIDISQLPVSESLMVQNGAVSERLPDAEGEPTVLLNFDGEPLPRVLTSPPLTSAPELQPVSPPMVAVTTEGMPQAPTGLRQDTSGTPPAVTAPISDQKSVLLNTPVMPPHEAVSRPTEVPPVLATDTKPLLQMIQQAEQQVARQATTVATPAPLSTVDEAPHGPLMTPTLASTPLSTDTEGVLPPRQTLTQVVQEGSVQIPQTVAPTTQRGEPMRGQPQQLSSMGLSTDEIDLDAPVERMRSQQTVAASTLTQNAQRPVDGMPVTPPNTRQQGQADVLSMVEDALQEEGEPLSFASSQVMKQALNRSTASIHGPVMPQTAPTVNVQPVNNIPVEASATATDIAPDDAAMDAEISTIEREAAELITRLEQSSPKTLTGRAMLSVGVSNLHPGWNDAFASRIRWMTSNGVKEAEIRLDPPSLGKLDVQLSVAEDGVLKVSFNAENAQAKELLDNALPRLREMMNQSGFDQLDVSVGHQRNEQEDLPDQPGQHAAQEEEGADEAMMEETTTTVSVSDAVVDTFA